MEQAGLLAACVATIHVGWLAYVGLLASSHQLSKKIQKGTWLGSVLHKIAPEPLPHKVGQRATVMCVFTPGLLG